MAEGRQGGQTGVRKYFFFIKENVTSHWKDLAYFLEFPQPRIDDIARRNPDDSSRCMDMLEEWLRLKGERATIEVLMEALSEGNLQSTVDGLKDKYPELAQEQGAAAASMSEAHRTLLLRNYPNIYQELDATRVLGHLYQEGVLTGEMRKEILAIPEERRQLRTGTLLQMILQGDDRAFTIFCEALGHAGYPHLMRLLTGGQQEPMIMPREYGDDFESWSHTDTRHNIHDIVYLLRLRDKGTVQRYHILHNFVLLTNDYLVFQQTPWHWLSTLASEGVKVFMCPVESK
ncbi:uncharacterized protein LOC144903548 [Branchiostoma floridae x Branchiostoma belcheri]